MCLEFYMTHDCVCFQTGKVRNWVDYFDYVIVDAKKPLFFAEGSILRQIDRVSSRVRLRKQRDVLIPIYYL